MKTKLTSSPLELGTLKDIIKLITKPLPKHSYYELITALTVINKLGDDHQVENYEAILQLSQQIQKYRQPEVYKLNQ